MQPSILCKPPLRNMFDWVRWTWTSYLNAIVYESPTVTGRPEMRILLCAGHLDAPYTLPGIIKLTVHRVNSWVMGGYSVTHVCGDPMLLKETQPGITLFVVMQNQTKSCAIYTRIQQHDLACIKADSDLCKLSIKSHLFCEHADVVEEMRLHVAPHVREPPELLPVSEQRVVTLIFLICSWRARPERDKDYMCGGGDRFYLFNSCNNCIIPVWKNLPENPRLKVKLGTRERSLFCVWSSA